MRVLLTTILLCSALAATGCRSARPEAAPAPVNAGEETTHAESAALVCEAQTPVASWERQLIVATPCTGGRTCEQAWDDLSRLTDQLLLFRCERVCGNGELLVGAQDIAPVLDGQPHPRFSFVRFGLDDDAGSTEPAFLVVQGFAQVPVEDSYALATALTERLAGFDIVHEPVLVPSDEATAMLVVQASEQQRLAEERRPLEGLDDDAQDAYAVTTLCTAWAEQPVDLSYPARLDRVLAAHPTLQHTAFPRVLAMAAPEAQHAIASTVAERAGQTEGCTAYLADLATWIDGLSAD